MNLERLVKERSDDNHARGISEYSHLVYTFSHKYLSLSLLEDNPADGTTLKYLIPNKKRKAVSSPPFLSSFPLSSLNTNKGKMASAVLPCTPVASIINKRTSIPKPLSFYSSASKKLCGQSMTCRAASSSSSSYSSVIDFDLYDLLGIDNSSNQSQIKMAYRTLQKRCHPDIAGPAGHDMAIILNEAYAVLSDPNSRSAYDKEQATTAELRGYTGKPIYSVWFGSEAEDRAVFVDEMKCVGCLKCALFADKTFAVESVYGRARVVAQWADPEDKIQAAIETCPVDCISVVERSDLAALEFLMSKQPRGNVRVGASQATGDRGSNIFVEVQKFQTRCADAMKKANSKSSKETDLQREARISAIQAIRSISNWLYWQPPKAEGRTKSNRSLTQIAQQSTEPSINKLREAAAARKLARESTGSIRRAPTSYIYHDEYWIPSTNALPAPINGSGNCTTSEDSQNRVSYKKNTTDSRTEENRHRSPIRWEILTVAAAFAAVVTRLQAGVVQVDGLNEHIGGSFALEIVNSSSLEVLLAGIMWYTTGAAIVRLVQALRDSM